MNLADLHRLSEQIRRMCRPPLKLRNDRNYPLVLHSYFKPNSPVRELHHEPETALQTYSIRSLFIIISLDRAARNHVTSD